MNGEEFLQSKDIWHHPRVSTRKSDVSYDIAELLDEFLETHTKQNSHKHGVMQGLPTESEIRAQALAMENPNDGYATKIIARAAYESGARWAISKMSSSPAVASEGQGEANMSAWPCPMCRALTINTSYEGYCCQSCFDGA